MKTKVIAVVAALCAYGCNAHEIHQQTSEITPTITDTIPKPQESWHVNKQFDKNGNVIGYDSTYTWSYTNMKGDSVTVNADSAMHAFDHSFSQHFPSIMGDQFIEPMWNDSLLYHDFPMEHYFRNRLDDHFFDMDKMIEQMDSMRSRFFQETSPGFTERSKGKRI